MERFLRKCSTNQCGENTLRNNHFYYGYFLSLYTLYAIFNKKSIIFTNYRLLVGYNFPRKTLAFLERKSIDIIIVLLYNFIMIGGFEYDT